MTECDSAAEQFIKIGSGALADRYKLRMPLSNKRFPFERVEVAAKYLCIVA